MKDLVQLVKDEITALGLEAASERFEVSEAVCSRWLKGTSIPPLTVVSKLMSDEEFDDLLTVQSPEQLEAEALAIRKNIEAHIVMWEGKKVMILIPCYRSLNPHTHFTLFANYIQYGSDKLGMVTKDRTVIHECRNELIHIAKSIPSIETVIMVDDDMILPCGNENIINGNFEMGLTQESARLSAISRIMSHGPDKEIVGALYYGRHKWGMPQCHWGFDEERGHRAQELRNGNYQGLIKLPWVGTGFMKIEMSAIRKLEAQIDAGKFPGLEPKPGRWYGYFTPISAGVGEDVSFCHRMGQIGVETYLDASLVCGHADGATIYGPSNTATKTT